MANVAQLKQTVLATAETEGQPASGLHVLASEVRDALKSYAAAAAEARLLSLNGTPPQDETRHARFYQQSYRPGAWGDPL